MTVIHERVAVRCAAAGFPITPAVVAEVERLLREERRAELADALRNSLHQHKPVLTGGDTRRP